MGTNANGRIVFEGPSRIDGKPIVVILTGLASKSANGKTGDMLQTWILRADMDPMQALRTGSDASICGGCIHRPKAHDGESYSDRSCYVNVGQAPLAVWRAYKRGSYASADYGDLPGLAAGRNVRLGSYGDPAAVPLGVWRALVLSAAGWTGYTHQWKSARLRDVTELCQVSADSCGDVDRAAELCVGSFRVRPLDPSHPDHAIRPDEMVCPASNEAGYKTDCASCQACRGASGQRVVILAHGATAKRFTGKPARKAVAA